jgi:hypothetical protein
VRLLRKALCLLLVIAVVALFPVAASAQSGFIGSAVRTDHAGHWLVTGKGSVSTEGQAQHFGDMGGSPLNKPIVGMASTPSNKGYWLVASDGGIFSFGDARFYGSTGSMRLNKPIVGMASTPSNKGYWLVASDGGIFSFGDARFYGSTGAVALNRPVVGMSSTESGKGYWLVAEDGGVFSFGDAGFHGSALSQGTQRAISIIRSSTDGYHVIKADGARDTRSAAPPAGNPPPVRDDWSLVAEDNFGGTQLNRNYWLPYDSVGHGGKGRRSPDAISVRDGSLRITGKGDVSGGMCWCGPSASSQTYGRWEVRARMDRGNGYSGVALLWPSSERWPEDGEIDITELVFGDRRESYFNLHYGADNKVIGHASESDFTQWHTFAVEWTPERISYFMNDELEFEVTKPEAIPRNPMHMTLQNDTGITPRDSSTPAEVTYYVDWVRIYE